MHKTNRKTAALLLALLAGAWPASAQAQEVNDVAGTYCLVGVMEVGSCIELSRDGKFEYFLAYGAYDEDSEGTWRIEGGQVVLDSPAYDRRAAFAFKRMQQGEGDGFDIVVESKGGRAMRGIDVSVICDGRTSRVGVTGAAGFKVDCREAPTHVLLGLRMYGVASQTIDVSAPDRCGQGLRVRVRYRRSRPQAVCRPAPRARWRQRQFPGHDLPRYADPRARRPHLPVCAAVKTSNLSSRPR